MVRPAPLAASVSPAHKASPERRVAKAAQPPESLAQLAASARQVRKAQSERRAYKAEPRMASSAPAVAPASYTMGGLIHFLLVVAVVMVLLNLISGRKPA